MIYGFGCFELDTHSRELYRDGQLCADLSNRLKLYEILLYLIDQRHHIVSYDDLLETIWMADENPTLWALTQLIGRLRKLIGDNDPQHPVIKTYRGVGYRFVASVEVRTPETTLVPRDLPPFVAGPPLFHPKHFFGRERELTRLFNLWQRSPLQHAAIIGPRRSGKTSLLLYVQHITTALPMQVRPGQRTDWLLEPSRYRWVYIDFLKPRYGTREGFFSYVLTALDLPLPTPCDLDRFLDVLSDHLRDPTVLMLDEIGVALERYSELDNTFWDSLRSLSTTAAGNHLAFVAAAQEHPHHLAQHSGFGSPFFNIFAHTTKLGPLTEAEATALLASSPLPFPATDRDWILAESQCWPFLLQTLCCERLLTLEAGESDTTWRKDGLLHIEPYRYLLERS